MRHITTLFLLIAFAVNLSAQNDIPVTAGRNCGKLKIGMTEKQVRDLLGNGLQVKTYKEEMTAFWYHNRTIRMDSITQFVLGFDKCLELSDSLNRYWPVFKIFLLNDKVNCMIITSYMDDSLLVKQVLVNNKLRFNDDQEKCVNYFGNGYINTPYPGYEEYVYYKKGIQLLFDEGVLKTFKIFKPDANFLNRIASRSAIIKAEFAAIDKEKGGINWPD
jgi:hypothetical protein